MYDLVAPARPEPDSADEILTAEDFDIELDDKPDDQIDEQEFVPPSIIHVADDVRYREFDPVSDLSLLASSTYAASFQELLE